MSRRKTDQADDLRPEYDFNRMEGGVRGKYFRRYHAGTNVAILEPDVAAAFPSDEAVNLALRAILGAARQLVVGRTVRRKASKPPKDAGGVAESPQPSTQRPRSGGPRKPRGR